MLAAVSDSADAVPLLADYGRGIYRRRIRLASEAGRVVGELQDDFHHFAVDLRHDGARVTGVRGGGLRVPWTTCGGAVPSAEALTGLPLGGTPREAGRYTDPRRQCTHLFDLAVLAVAHATRAPGTRSYDVSVPDRVRGRTRATLHRDGQAVLAWQLEGDHIQEPEPFRGRSISDRGFAAFAAALPADSAEAVAVLRRAVFISIGRRYDFEAMTRAAPFGKVVGAACHTFSEESLATATRNPGTRRDFGADPSPVFCRGFSSAFEQFLRAGPV